LESLEIGDRQLCLVVEHLLEVRHVPIAIDRVTMESAAEMIVYSARRHLAQSREIYLQRAFS
jgi:hypothetical protein